MERHPRRQAWALWHLAWNGAMGKMPLWLGLLRWLLGANKKNKFFKRKGPDGPSGSQGSGSGNGAGNGKKAKTGGGGQSGGGPGEHGKISRAERDRRFKEGLCLYCGEKNHKAAGCPKKSSQGPVN
ncbi:hypothetical protein KFL_008210080 [Klebsormidium nitens]|uniref:CCHC-type domain-containing protein n=1 Tax=Klebsormidium nitens TaxID=105231 RepID=A0A1Y1IQ70_KLENI|nr:hypothetical protein KFL_008210080 [Klebsormidium nitens]|eukprot:GAQ91629.1 hypothetical protein KFL_008210080 [Klebsormidium nitens]